MSKRSSEINLKNPKKARKNEMDNTFWDDDLDDDCFDALANEILEKDVPTQNSKNVSAIPSYETFRPDIPYASTQITGPSTQPTDNNELAELKLKIEFLQQKCETKEGEVAILRTNLQKIKAEIHDDHVKQLKENTDYIRSKEKELESIKSELGFKQLEIAHLKQKNAELLRLNQSVVNHIEVQKKKRTKGSPPLTESIKNVKENEVHITPEPYFPLISRFPIDFFKVPSNEVHLIDNKCNGDRKKLLNFLHSHTDNRLVAPILKVAKNGKTQCGFGEIIPDMVQMVQCSSYELENSTDCNNNIERIFQFSCKLLESFRNYLCELQKYYRTEDIEEFDRNYLNNNNRNKTTQNFEIGISASKIVDFIGEILEYNTHLQDLITKETPYENSNYSYLSLLNEATMKIFYLRQTEACNTFLKSVAKFLTKLSYIDELFEATPDLKSSIWSTISFLLFTRPKFEVIAELQAGFKNYAKYKEFLDFLCNKNDSKTFKSDKKRKVHYFSQDSCKFALFTALFTLHSSQEESSILSVANDLMSFVFNIFFYNPYWVHDYQKNELNLTNSGCSNIKNRCFCLKQLYQIVIEVAYKLVKHFDKNPSWEKIPQNKQSFISIVEIFKLLKFNSCDLLENNIELYSKYKETVCALNELLKQQHQGNLVDKLDMKKLTINEESVLPVIPAEKLDLLC